MPTLAHWPCRTFSPGTLLVQTTLPSFLLKQTMAGALGAGMFLCVSSPPLPVVMYAQPLSLAGAALVMLCGKTASWLIMSTCQSGLGCPPVLSGAISQHHISQRLVG